MLDMEQPECQKLYSTDDESWQQEILVIIGYNKTIMSMSDDLGK